MVGCEAGQWVAVGQSPLPRPPVGIPTVISTQRRRVHVPVRACRAPKTGLAQTTGSGCLGWASHA